jgi:hypothetical protein
MRSLLHLALPVIALALVGGCHRKVDASGCTRMLDRYIDMVIDSDPASKSLSPPQAAAVRDMKKAVKKAEPTYARVEQQCRAEVSRSEYDCAMAAKTPDEWEACIE